MIGINSQFSMGGGVRSGGRPRRRNGAAALAAQAAGRAENAAEDAGRQRSYRQAASPPVQSGPSPEEMINENPYAKFAETQAGGDDKPGKLPGGTMGTKPDFSEVERIQRDWKNDFAKRSPFIGMFQPGVAYNNAKDAKFQGQLEIARDQAIRDWQDALRAAEEEKAKNTLTLVDGVVLPTGQAVARRHDGSTVPWSQEVTSIPEDRMAPLAPEFDPYREVTRQVPIMESRSRERNEIGRQADAGDARDTERATLTHSQRLIEEARKAKLERGLNQQQHGLSVALETHKAGLRPEPTPAGSRPSYESIGVIEKTILENAIASAGGADAWRYLPAAEQKKLRDAERAALKAEYGDIAVRGGSRGENQTRGPAGTSDYGGPVTKTKVDRKDGTERENIREGVKVKERWNAKTKKWVIVAELK